MKQKSFLMRPLLMIFGFLVLGYAICTNAASPNAYARAVYPYQNEEGFFTLPGHLPVYTTADPGPWKHLIQEHTPVLKIRLRNDGLEDLTMIELSVPHPMPPVPEPEELEEDETFDEPRLTQIYIVDKDRIILSYYQFLDNETTVKVKTMINGIINYFEIYIVCTHHGIWKSEHTLKHF